MISAAIDDSRFAPLAPWRVADCLWTEGRKEEAVAAYRKLLAKPPAGVDVVVARFRVAELEPPAERTRLFLRIHADHPAHPLAAEAARRVPSPSGGPEATASDPRTQLRRAAVLVEGKRFTEAIAELEALPADLPAKLKAERDFELGMARFRTRNDYAAAAAALLDVAPRLDGEKAPFAAFHGARALTRAGRTDEAIVAARAVVERYPRSRWAIEAQFLTGWLEFNRARYAEALPGLKTTIERHRKSPQASDAAWYLALAYHFLERYDEALTALAEHAGLSGSSAEVARRVAYWRGRFLVAKGDTEDGKKLWRDLVKEQPFSYYGLLARARLLKAREKVTLALPDSTLKLPPVPRAALKDPALLRVEELARAGLTVEAGVELVRSEDALEGRLGREPALALLLERYPRYLAFRRAYQLGDARAEALQWAPKGSARAIWESNYPRAYRDEVERRARTERVPPLFVYSIMHKESGFSPTVTSIADARGLLQLLPSLGAELSAKLRRPFVPEDLFRPEVNIQLGAHRLGTLLQMFSGQLFLAAGAYNGGTLAAQRWLSQHGARPLDEFLELVGYRESREYMKRVTGIHARYSYLYTGKLPDLSLTVKVPKEPARPAKPTRSARKKTAKAATPAPPRAAATEEVPAPAEASDDAP